MVNLDNENIIHVVKENIEIIQFRKLLEFPNLIHGYTLKKKNLSFDRENKDSYKIISDLFNIDSVILPYQTHTDNVEIVKGLNNVFKDVDGLITDKNGIMLASTSADCISLLFFDTKKNIIANVHSGWRGTMQKIGKKAVEKMIKVYESNPEDIICCICPSIRKCHFEVDTDVREIFENEFEYTGELDSIISKGEIKEGKQKYFIDTVLINRIILKEMGLKEENIIDSGICTVCHSDEFHSYRVNKTTYRNAAVIAKK